MVHTAMLSRPSALLLWSLFVPVVGPTGCKHSQPQQHTTGRIAATPGTGAPTPAIDHERMLADLKTLASDAAAGRFTRDRKHLDAAALLIANSHRAAGIRPVASDYSVEFEFVAKTEPGSGFYLWVESAGDTAEIPPSAVLAASFSSAEASIGPAAWIDDGAIQGAAGFIAVTPAPEGNLVARIRALQSAEATGALLLIPTLPSATSLSPELRAIDFPVAFVTEAVARQHLSIPTGAAPKTARELAGVQISLARNTQDVTGHASNVLAWIEGSARPDEIILLGAHYDHIGTKGKGIVCRGPNEDEDPQDEICNGADDNASGTAMLLALARALAESNYRPKRSIVFAHFAGEEIGLLGSKAIAEHPPAARPFSDGKVVAMLNMDMVGRLSPQTGLQVGGETTSPAWPAIVESAVPPGLKIVHPASVTGRSDHAHWFRQGIPILFFFTGLHDDYHRTSDEFERINGEGMRMIGALVLGVVRALADGADIPAAAKAGHRTSTQPRATR